MSNLGLLDIEKDIRLLHFHVSRGTIVKCGLYICELGLQIIGVWHPCRQLSTRTLVRKNLADLHLLSLILIGLIDQCSLSYAWRTKALNKSNLERDRSKIPPFSLLMTRSLILSKSTNISFSCIRWLWIILSFQSCRLWSLMRRLN